MTKAEPSNLSDLDPVDGATGMLAPYDIIHRSLSDAKPGSTVRTYLKCRSDELPSASYRSLECCKNSLAAG